MENYPSNSHRKQQPSGKKVERVIDGPVTVKKTRLGRKFAQTFIQGDARTAWSSTLWEVLIPAIKESIWDSMIQGGERTVFGDVRGRSRTRHGNPIQQTVYNKISGGSVSRPDPRTTAPKLSQQARKNHDFGELTVESRVAAQIVLDSMYDLLAQFDQVTVKDLYDLTGYDGDYPDNNWGWLDLQGAEPVRTRDGDYILSLPRPVPLT